MRKLILIVPIVSLVSWAAVPSGKSSSKTVYERLDPEDEAALVGCNFVKRSPETFREDYNAKTISASQALLKDWLNYPSQDFRKSGKYKSIDAQYKGAYCEMAYQSIVMDMTGDSDFIGPRCQALSEDDCFAPEYNGEKNTCIKSRQDSTPETDAEEHWCNGREAKSALIDIACRARESHRVAFNQSSGEYKKALNLLKAKCRPYIGEPNRKDQGVNPIARRDGGRYIADSSQGQGPIIVPRYIRQYPGMYGGCGQRSNLNVISYRPSTLSTITQTLLMGAGIYAQYRGQHEADKMAARLTASSIDAIKFAGGIPLVSVGGAGGYFGQNGGIMGMNGGMMGGGMCGSPPFNTAHTGCMGGGQIGMPVGGGCPGGMCGGGGGMPCGAGGGSGMPCGAGGGGMQGNCGGWGCGGSAGCRPGMPCQGYMNDPILGARPGGLNGGYTPFDLDFEKQRTQQMLDDARRRNQALSDLARRQQELNDIRRKADEANRKYNSAYDGYNGMLANQYGPGGGNGNPGMYQGPGGGRGCGGPGMPPCGGGGPGGMFAGGGNGMYPGGGCGGMPCNGGGGPVAGCGGGSSCGGCTSMMCYPGMQSAYYSPPYATGNYGQGGGIYPQRNNGFFVNFKYDQFSQAPKNKDSANAR